MAYTNGRSFIAVDKKIRSGQMHILVLNSGSFSIKYSIYDMENESPMISGRFARFGESESICINPLS